MSSGSKEQTHTFTDFPVSAAHEEEEDKADVSSSNPGLNVYQPLSFHTFTFTEIFSNFEAYGRLFRKLYLTLVCVAIHGVWVK